jgi:asparagine synthase (glutamine-hydrolysing)
VAARHVKVALSGDGGDELFCGYQRYLGRVLLRWYARLPGPLRISAERAIQALPEPMVHHSRSLLKKAHLFLDMVRRSAAETPYIAPVMYHHDAFAALAPDLAGRGHPAPFLPQECELDDIWRMMAADALVYLPQDILVKVDRASMAWSLEARAPFLDRGVVELAFSLPRRFHMPSLRGKHMLRRTFPDVVPAAIWRRRKQGFAVPIHRWFRGDLGRELEALLAASSAPVAAQHVRHMLQQHRAGRRDHGYRLWHLFVYCLWRDRLMTSSAGARLRAAAGR